MFHVKKVGLISYTEIDNPDSTRYVTVFDACWDGKELDSNIASYNVEIQAIGIKQSSTIEGILTGPSCYVGKLSKLKTPVAQVKDGLICWQDLQNATYYVVNTYNERGGLYTYVDVQKYPDLDNFIWYENQIEATNYTFKFKAMGDRDLVLDDTTLAYLNSEVGNGIVGTTVDTIQNVKALGGKLVWDIATNNSVQVTYYKLIFNKIDEYNYLMDSEIIVSGNSFTESLQSCAYSCDSLDEARYQVTIQGYFNTEDTMGRYTYEGDTAYYLISKKSTVYVFEKYPSIVGEDQSGLLDNIVIRDGEFSWKYSGEIDPQNYLYELKFITNDGIMTIIQPESYFFDYVLDELVNNEPFELDIRVIAKEDTLGYVNSNYLRFANVYHDNSTLIYQLDYLLFTILLSNPIL